MKYKTVRGHLLRRSLGVQRKSVYWDTYRMDLRCGCNVKDSRVSVKFLTH